MSRRLLIIGAGGHGRAVCEMARLLGWQVAGFLDDRGAAAPPFADARCLGLTSELVSFSSAADAAIVAIGNNSVRRALVGQVRDAGLALASLVHPQACVSPCAEIGEGVAIMAGAIVATEAVLGDGVIINAGATVDHHCRVDAFGHLGTGVSMAGGSQVEAGGWVQAGAALGYSARVLADEVLPPGAVRTQGA